MELFGNALFDTILFLVLLIFISQILIPIWKETPWFPTIRKFYSNMNKTKNNVLNKPIRHRAHMHPKGTLPPDPIVPNTTTQKINKK